MMEESKMGKIFISYSHKDSEYAHRLANVMGGHGFEVWIDDRINYGDQWPKVIQENLERSDAMVVIMTSNALNSEWVHREVIFAQQMSKPIFPILLEGKSLLALASTQYIDVRGGKLPPNDFYGKLKQALGSTKPKPGILGRIAIELGMDSESIKKDIGMDTFWKDIFGG